MLVPAGRNQMMSEKSNTAILLLTCDRYVEVATLTLDLLRQLWKDPPQIFVCGVSGGLPGESVIPFNVDDRDWMGIAHQASEHLLEEGYGYCYLILDDHPPVARCNGEYLANQVPALARQLKAAAVSMVGWDQVRTYRGTRLGAEKHYWLRNDPSYRWLFNLHPACWDIQAFKEILERAMASGRDDRSARTFEACTNSAVTLLPERLLMGSYRVCGDRFASTGKWYGDPVMRKGILLALHGARFAGKLLGGDSLLKKIDGRSKLFTDYLNGPYPMFWSGLMQKGEVHANAVRFLRLSGLGRYADIAGRLAKITG